MVPRSIHAFWHSEEAGLPIPREAKLNLDRWRATHPLFQLKVWSLAEVRPILAKTPGAVEAVDSCRFITMQADIVRLALLDAYGGIWTDLKNLPLQPFLDDLLDRSEATFAEWLASVREDHINNCFIVAPPQQSFILACLHEAVRLVLRRQAGSLWNITAGGMVMRMMQSHKDWRILPALEVWGPRGGSGGWMTRTKVSYNTDHWSKREKTESLYL